MSETIEAEPNDPTQPITLSQLKEKIPPFRDVPVPGIGVMRLHRLPAIEQLKYQVEIGEIADENGDADREQAMNMMLGFVSRSLGGEFATDEGLLMLKCLGPAIQMQLIQEASGFHGLGAESINKGIEDAKND